MTLVRRLLPNSFALLHLFERHDLICSSPSTTSSKTNVFGEPRSSPILAVLQPSNLLRTLFAIKAAERTVSDDCWPPLPVAIRYTPVNTGCHREKAEF